jgi:hypothetical protein
MPQLPLKVNLESKDWRRILEEVDKKEIPVEVMERLTVNMRDGTSMEINIRDLILNGEDPTIVHNNLQKRLDDMDKYIDDIDFHINIDAVVNTIQPVTDKILKDL